MAGKLIEKIKLVLQENLPGVAVDELEKSGRSGKIGGVLVWDAFRDLEQVERQEKVWSVLRASLSKDEQLSISLLITLTPDELKSIRAA